MNFQIGICPKCRENSNIELLKENIIISCNCGYHNSINIKAFVDEYQRKKSLLKDNDKVFSNQNNEIKNGYAHLNSYFFNLKNKHINQMLCLINEIESSYERSYQRNKRILSFLEILIDNFNGSQAMKSTIVNNQINIYKCNDEKKIIEVTKFFNEYYINKENNKLIDYEKEVEFTIEAKSINRRRLARNKDSFTINSVLSVKSDNFKVIKTITKHTTAVHSLLWLKNNKIASCSGDKTINIYNVSNDYNLDIVLQRHNDTICSICELDDGTIVSCSTDKSIIIGDHIILNAHEQRVKKVITLPNNRIASCSDDTTIKIWKSDSPYSDTPIVVLTGHSESVMSILYIKERDIMISGSIDGTLRMWNMSTYQCDTMVIGVVCSWINSLYQIDDDRVIVGKKNKFSIVNITKCSIENSITDKGFGSVLCFLKLRDNNTIICGCDNRIFCFYDMKDKKYSINNNNHDSSIEDLLSINDNTFISCSYDKIIKVWKY